MGDVFSPEKRSQVMAAIRAKNTRPELAVRQALYALGIRYRLHVGTLPGRPDIVIRRLRLAIEVKGCFWHGHRCLRGRVPGTNRPYWSEKIAGNRQRDKRNERALRRTGWRVVTLWECSIRRWPASTLSSRLEAILARVSSAGLKR
jgi:DNA mismatch endonuclease (patch repair protein)